MALPRTVIRPLGGYEQYSTSRHALGLYKNVITVCRYALPSPALGEEQVKACIRKAVATVLLEKLPALRVGISGEDSKRPAFVALPSLQLDDHLEWVLLPPGLAASEYDARLLRELERGNARPWPDVERHAPWRLTVYLNAADGWADLAFAVHHAVGDGRSGQVFHTVLVELLNSQEEPRGDQEAPSLFEFTEVPTLVPSQEVLVRFKISWPFLVKSVWAELVPSWLKGGTPHGAAYTGPRVTMEPKLKGRLRVFHLAPPHAAALLAGCRTHGVTLTALLHGLMMVLFARRFPPDVASAFSCIMPVSMRPYVTVPADFPLQIDRSMANLVSGHHYIFESDAVAAGRDVAETEEEEDEKVWRAAAAVGTSIKARLANIVQDNLLGLMGWVSDWHQFWRTKEGTARDGTWAVSNMGSIAEAGEVSPDAPPPRWRLTRQFYTQSSLGKDPLVCLVVGGVRGGELSFVVAWHQGVVTNEFADAFADDLQACLVRYGETGHFGVPNRLAEPRPVSK